MSQQIIKISADNTALKESLEVAASSGRASEVVSSSMTVSAEEVDRVVEEWKQANLGGLLQQ